jgi:hypothetical protein
MSLLHVKVKCIDCGKEILKCNAKHCCIPASVRRSDPRYPLIQFVRNEKPKICQRDLRNYYCSDCYEKRLKKERLLMSRESYELAEKFSDLLSTCEKMGVCDVLSVHHELLKDDPERLTTDFLLGLVCRKDVKYVGKKTFNIEP